MKKILFIVFFISSVCIVSAQISIPEENLSIEMVKARKIGFLSIQKRSDINILSGKGQKRIQLRLKLRSLDEESTPFDPNKLSLVIDYFKLRFSASEVNFAELITTRAFVRMTDNDSEEDKTRFARYDPSIRNTFFDYHYKDYKEVLIQLNFGTRKNPIIHTIYFAPNEVDRHVLDVYFNVPNEITFGKLFYGNTLISEIKVR